MSNRAQLSPADVRPFILGGHAKFTVLNTDSGKRFTYKVNGLPDEPQKDIRLVKVLNGPDNYENYLYIGAIIGGVFRLTKGSKCSDNALSSKAFDWTWRNLETLPEKVEIWHEGRCGMCGRTLTVPESIASGIGPICADKMGIS